MKRQLLLTAVEEEAAPLIRPLRNARTHSCGQIRWTCGELAGQPVAISYGGVCKVNAAATVQCCLDHLDCSGVWMCGTAGAMDPRCQIGDVVVVTRCAYHDVDNQGVLIEAFPYRKSCWFDSDPQALRLAFQAASAFQPRWQVFYGSAVSGEQFIDQKGRDAIVSAFSPLCVDMETAAAAHVCSLHDVPFAAVRAISDTPFHSGLDVYHQHSAEAAEHAAALILAMLRQRSAGTDE